MQGCLSVRNTPAHACTSFSILRAGRTHLTCPQTVSGNYVAAKRKGVVGGLDYQLTGMVRFVQVGECLMCLTCALVSCVV